MDEGCPEAEITFSSLRQRTTHRDGVCVVWQGALVGRISMDACNDARAAEAQEGGGSRVPCYCTAQCHRCHCAARIRTDQVNAAHLVSIPGFWCKIRVCTGAVFYLVYAGPLWCAT